MATYVYDLSKSLDVKRLEKDFNNLTDMFSSKEFKEYIADKCLKELDDIQSYSIANYDNENIDVDRYQNNHKVEYGDDYIIILNDTALTQSELWWVSDETRKNYPDGISIAYIIEYGTGVLGTPQDDWQTDVNSHGEKGWAYKNPNTNKFVWTKGIEGKFIYLQLLDRVKEKFADWTNEYMEKKGW